MSDQRVISLLIMVNVLESTEQSDPKDISVAKI